MTEKIFEYNHYKPKFVRTIQNLILWYQDMPYFSKIRKQLTSINKSLCELIEIFISNYKFFQKVKIPFPIAFNLVRNIKINYSIHSLKECPPHKIITIIQDNNNIIDEQLEN